MYKHATKGPIFSCEASTPSTMTPVSGDPEASGPSTPTITSLGPAMASLEIGPVEPVELFPETLVDNGADHHLPSLPPPMDGLTLHSRDALVENTFVDDPNASECYTRNQVNVTDGMLCAPDTQVYTNDMLFSFNTPVGGMASSSHETGVAYDPMVVDTQVYEDVYFNPPGPAYETSVCYTPAAEMNYDRPDHHTCMVYDTEMSCDCSQGVVFGPPCSTFSSDLVYGNDAASQPSMLFVDGATPAWPHDAVMASHPDLLDSQTNEYEVTSTDSYWCGYDAAQPAAPCSTPMNMVSQFGSVAHGESQYIPDEDLQAFLHDFTGLSSAVIEVDSGSEQEHVLHEVHQNDRASICNREHQAL